MSSFMIDRERIKSWFEKGDIPTEDQFHYWIENCLYKFDDLDTIVFSETLALLPTVGKEKIIYVIENEKALYGWDVLNNKYKMIVQDSSNIHIIDGNVEFNK